MNFIVGFLKICAGELANLTSCPFEIFTTDKKTMYMRAFTSPNGDPLDLSQATDIEVNLPLSAGGYIALTLEDGEVTVISPYNYGKISVEIDAEVAATLNVGLMQDIDVIYTIDEDPVTVRFYGALNVLEGQ